MFHKPSTLYANMERYTLSELNIICATVNKIYRILEFTRGCIKTASNWLSHICIYTEDILELETDI